MMIQSKGRQSQRRYVVESSYISADKWYSQLTLFSQNRMSFVLPELPYNKGDFGKIISEETFNYHYGKHHQTYVDNLNNLVKGTEWEGRTLSDIVINCKDTKIFNNAAQHWNHSFYWYCISPEKTTPSPQLQALLEKGWGSTDNFLKEFAAQAVGNFGSGWTWLVKKGDDLEIVNTSNAGNPLTGYLKPLLTVDVWEHAYYIDYRNLRASYVNNFNTIINWNYVNDNLKSNQAELKLKE